MASGWLRGLVLTLAFVGLAACSSTATQTTSIDSRTGTSQQISGTVRIGSLFDSRYVGRWTMSDRFARSCTYQFSAGPMGGSASIAKATPSGYCVPPFDDVAGWRSSGSGLVLFASDGDRLANLSREGSNVYRGRFRGARLSTDVTLRKGFV